MEVLPPSLFIRDSRIKNKNNEQIYPSQQLSTVLYSNKYSTTQCNTVQHSSHNLLYLEINYNSHNLL
uniref:Uncharacterized protein n=1 Tax=Arundo donax TaxID=35708 RepID=A0A0A9F5R9_ARUDO